MFVTLLIIKFTTVSSATGSPTPSLVIVTIQLPPLVFMVLSKTAALFATVATLKPPFIELLTTPLACTFVKLLGTSSTIFPSLGIGLLE